jgi:hypothetical protein
MEFRQGAGGGAVRPAYRHGARPAPSGQGLALFARPHASDLSRARASAPDEDVARGDTKAWLLWHVVLDMTLPDRIAFLFQR